MDSVFIKMLFKFSLEHLTKKFSSLLQKEVEIWAILALITIAVASNITFLMTVLKDPGVIPRISQRSVEE